MTNKMRILNNHSKWHDEISILFLSFAFVVDEIEVDEESLKMTVFWCLEDLSWKLEICCDCKYEFEESDFEKMSKIFVWDVEKACK